MKRSYFGEWLQGEMDAIGLIQSKLAGMAGVTRSTVSKWLSGRLLPSDAAVDSLSRVLDVDSVFLHQQLSRDRQNVSGNEGPGVENGHSFEECRDVAHSLLSGPPSQPKKADPYIKIAENLARESNDSNLLADAMLLRARYYTDLSRFGLAWDTVDSAVNLPDLKDEVLSRLEINKALADLHRGAPRDALKSAKYVSTLEKPHEKALIFANSICGQAIVQLGGLKKRDSWGEAIEYQKEAIRLAREHGGKYEDLAQLSLAYIANVEGRRGDSQAAVERLVGVIEWATENNDWEVEGEARAFRAEILLDIGKIDTTLEDDINRVHRMGSENDDPRLESWANTLRLRRASRLKELFNISVSSSEAERIKRVAKPALGRLQPKNPVRVMFQRAFAGIHALALLFLITGCNVATSQSALDAPSKQSDISLSVDIAKHLLAVKSCRVSTLAAFGVTIEGGGDALPSRGVVAPSIDTPIGHFSARSYHPSTSATGNVLLVRNEVEVPISLAVLSPNKVKSC
ncbi:MAG: helix-turn-helix transcriptional regulator [bacterium]